MSWLFGVGTGHLLHEQIQQRIIAQIKAAQAAKQAAEEAQASQETYLWEARRHNYQVIDVEARKIIETPLLENNGDAKTTD